MRENLNETLPIDLYLAEMINFRDQRDNGTPFMSLPFGADDIPKPQWEAVFELTEGEYTGHQIRCWVNKPQDENNVHPNAKIMQLARAMLPKLGRGASWGLEDLLHKSCRLQVEIYLKADGTEANKITKFLPPKMPWVPAVGRVPVEVETSQGQPLQNTTAIPF